MDGNSNGGRQLEQADALMRLTLSALQTRKDFLAQAGLQFGGDRDLYDVLGYKKSPEFNDYEAKYERLDIAGRIVDMPAEDTWRTPPRILDDAGPDGAFATQLKALADRLRLWHYLERLDRRSGIGRFGVMLIGLAGQAKLDTEAQKVRKADGVIYLSVYDEGSAEIVELEKDPSSPRFGQPKTYKINLGVDIDGKQTDKKTIHHSRLIHAAEDLGEGEVYGRPRLRRVYNRLDDIEKVVGAGAEATWKLIYKGVIASTKDGYTLGDGGAGNENSDRQSEIDEYVHGIRRWLELEGMDVSFEGGETVDPTGMFSVLVDLISAGTDIPKRILLGSERGELASTTDASTWAGNIKSRQTKHAEPILLRPTIDRLIGLGALPEPKGGQYEVKWEAPFEMDAAQEAEIASKAAQAIQAIAPAGSPDMVVDGQRFIQVYLPKLAAASVDPGALLDREDADGIDTELPAQGDA